MRLLCASFVVCFGLLGLVPESMQACDRPGYAPVSYGYARPMYSGYYPAAPMYAPGAYYAPYGFYPQGSVAQSSLPSPSPGVTNAAAATEVTASDDKFEPATITVAPGTTVRWTNKGAHKHTTTSTTGAWDSGDLAPGQSYTATFTKAGTFEYSCAHHKEMKGTIVVK